MKLFTPDLYRNFGIGFAAGALTLVFNNGEILSTVPQLVASIF